MLVVRYWVSSTSLILIKDVRDFFFFELVEKKYVHQKIMVVRGMLKVLHLWQNGHGTYITIEEICGGGCWIRNMRDDKGCG